MKRWLPVVFFATLLLAFAACRKAGGKSPIPQINFLGLAPDSVHAGSIKDTVFLAFDFNDGDGDLGNDPSTGNYDVFLRDNRDTVFPVMRYLFPNIPDEAVDPLEGIKGTGVVAIRGVTLKPRNDTLHIRHGDTLTFTMWVTDRAGNRSNTFTTPPIHILP